MLASFKFYAVFSDSEDFTVRCDSEEIGTITTPPPVGDRFALAGRVWEVTELDVARRLVYVKGVDGKMEISWPGDYGEIHTRILERMKSVLGEDTVYAYLGDNAKKRLEIARALAKNTGMLTHSLVHLGGMTWCMFPWLGTRSFRTIRKFLAKHSTRFGISGIEFEGCYYIKFRMERGSGEELARFLAEALIDNDIDALSLVGVSELPTFEKYDEYVPGELLRYAYSLDRLNPAEAKKRIFDIANEYH